MIPEVDSLAAPDSLVRIPPELDVPVTNRVMRIMDSRPLRRLKRVSQLGLVADVYPGAVHSRFEHSLGVYRNALQFVHHLSGNQRFVQCMSPRDVEAFIVACLVHDAGHWPYCHPIEDMGLAAIPKHESRVRSLLQSSELCNCIAEDWQCDVGQILRILEKTPESPAEQLAASMLSGPIDVDKLDYLIRDSLHAGVPYGRNFDAGRLIHSLCVHPHGWRLAMGEKGRTAAEMMVFARYVMFSEVYWHHAVRSATAMLQRSVFLLADRLDFASLLDLDDEQWGNHLLDWAEGSPGKKLAVGLFGERRRLHKRIAQFSALEDPELHAMIAHRPYDWLSRVSGRVAARLSEMVGMTLDAGDVLLDAPPVKLEVDINMDVVSRDGTVRPLGEVSPVVDALARRQFDSHVKRVRLFVPEAVRQRLREIAPVTADAKPLSVVRRVLEACVKDM